ASGAPGLTQAPPADGASVALVAAHAASGGTSHVTQTSRAPQLGHAVESAGCTVVLVSFCASSYEYSAHAPVASAVMRRQWATETTVPLSLHSRTTQALSSRGQHVLADEFVGASHTRAYTCMAG